MMVIELGDYGCKFQQEWFPMQEHSALVYDIWAAEFENSWVYI